MPKNSRIFQSSRPLRGATVLLRKKIIRKSISILAPLTGRDGPVILAVAARHQFQSSRPLRGATCHPSCSTGSLTFQSSRPLRGATRHASSSSTPPSSFQSSRPLRGATWRSFPSPQRQAHFNPRAPYGARQQKYTKIACVFAITDKGQMLFPRQAPPVRTLFEGAGGNRNDTRCEPSRKYRMLALRTTGSSAPLEGMFVCSQSVRSYSHTFSRDNKTEGCPFLHP